MARYMRVMKLLLVFIGERLARRASPRYLDDEIKPWIALKKRVSFDFLHLLASKEMLIADPMEVIRQIRVPIVLVIGNQARMPIVSQGAAAEAARQNSLVQVMHLVGVWRRSQLARAGTGRGPARGGMLPGSSPRQVNNPWTTPPAGMAQPGMPWGRNRLGQC
jgi:hypothetical protein